MVSPTADTCSPAIEPEPLEEEEEEEEFYMSQSANKRR
jgi:hypothetical protein